MSATATRSGRYIYIACPWTPKGGGMYKVADYLIQAQSAVTPDGWAELRPLDTRGGSSAVYSMWVLATALAKVIGGRVTGRLAGVHVNMAERLSVVRKGAIMAMCRALGVPVVLHLHAAQLHQSYRKSPRPLQALTRWVFSLPSTCVVLGTAAKQFVTNELRVPVSKIEMVANGVPEPCAPRRTVAPGRTQQVLFLGNSLERKGASDLLRALAVSGFDSIDFELSLVSGDDAAPYRTLAQQLGVDSVVRFEGWLDQAKAARLLANADVLVLPSYGEGLPLVILEAMANGVALVCTPVGEIPSVLTDGVNACFVQPGNVAAIAASLQRVLQQPQLREALERNGRALYEEQFSLRTFFTNLAAIHMKHFGVCGHAMDVNPSPSRPNDYRS